MILRRIKYASAILVGCLFAFLSNAQTADILAYRQAKQEFAQAEQSALDRQQSTESVQHRLDNLTGQRELWQREIVNAKAKASFAREKLTQASTAGVREDVEKWRLEASNWEARAKAAIVEEEKVESDIHDTVQTLQTSIKGNPGSDLILPGQSVEVYVAEDDSLNTVYQVRRGGYILMPRVGRISLAGKDLAGAEKAIKEALQVNQIKNATVMVERPSGAGSSGDPVIYLAGEFTTPGAWKIPHDLSPTIVTTILRSGGLTPAADLTKVRLLRLVSGEALVEEVNVQAILNGAGLPSDVSLQPGDIVMVPAYANSVYVTGNVMKPGALKLMPDDELTVYSAILRAGGFSRFANRDKIYVLRDTGNGVKKRIPVSIKSIQNEGGSDLILKSKDIVVVPERFFSW
jgi:protein involved in polysaccharide export with SLBB domain